MGTAARVRPAADADRAAIAAICLATGCRGAPVGDRFGDAALFALLFAEPYLAYAGARAWVAVEAGGVAGYCLTVADTDAYRRWHRAVHQRAVLRRIARSTLWRSPRDVARLVRWDTGPKLPGPADLLSRYPAHFHVNVAPAHQKKGLGKELLATAFAHWRALGVPGVHLRTTSRNAAALALYAQLGFETLASGPVGMWREAGVEALLMGRPLGAPR